MSWAIIAVCDRLITRLVEVEVEALGANLALGTLERGGINDALAVRADVINILEPRPWHLRLYDLAGHALVERSQAVTAGAQDFTWDGRDQAEQLVPPGLYLLELHLDGDAHQQRIRRVVSVVY